MIRLPMVAGWDHLLPAWFSRLDPRYRTPRSVEINVGVQRELRPGMLLSADYVRNVQTHYFLGIDENHAGDVHYFNKAAAQEAIAATLAAGDATAGRAVAGGSAIVG